MHNILQLYKTPLAFISITISGIAVRYRLYCHVGQSEPERSFLISTMKFHQAWACFGLYNVFPNAYTSHADDISVTLQAPMSIDLGKDKMSMTDSLVTLIKEMTPGEGPRVSNPGRLYSDICARVERFKGYQQQDSHELLRTLLDSLRNEELSVLHYNSWFICACVSLHTLRLFVCIDVSYQYNSELIAGLNSWLVGFT